MDCNQFGQTTVCHLKVYLHRAGVLLEIHGLKSCPSVATVAALAQAAVGKVPLLAAFHKSLIGASGLALNISDQMKKGENYPETSSEGECLRRASTGPHPITSVLAAAVALSAATSTNGRNWRGSAAAATDSRGEATKG